ncbi:hypothetical protein RVR_10509 [Actinacidiphila reveromycinica]|uniref:Uncharacterized protein n=1 Tax=Actinacidiphila reveromycinica TaxID=659352 RepID=A0A7U3UT15_9ACTN|nr:hypothetical protein RVR_10509 [Streptomyces sp. SN-593]
MRAISIFARATTAVIATMQPPRSTHTNAVVPAMTSPSAALLDRGGYTPKAAHDRHGRPSLFPSRRGTGAGVYMWRIRMPPTITRVMIPPAIHCPSGMSVKRNGSRSSAWRAACPWQQQHCCPCWM